MKSVHPRARGEHAHHAARRGGEGGSSPRARGTREGHRRLGVGDRFIPARAGNTPSRPTSTRSESVHPRARAEHLLLATCPSASGGSSPRARGTPFPPRGGPVPGRFIPARAGNTCTATTPIAPRAVHPRARGEHLVLTQSTFPWSGSSPRARGTPELGHAPPGLARLIPARAGNTGSRRPRRKRPAVHPRARGEHLSVSTDGVQLAGSSPRARGTLLCEAQDMWANRFIPARAGNTGASRCRTWRRTVHPRARGEHLAFHQLEPREYGSSPRARGTRELDQPGRLGGRFIPARAGNTSRTAVSVSCKSVHPRARGEHCGAATYQAAPGGSSPRARGTRHRDLAATRTNRFIPARAGNTRRRPGPKRPGSVHPRARGEHPSSSWNRDRISGSSPRARGTRAGGMPVPRA